MRRHATAIAVLAAGLVARSARAEDVTLAQALAAIGTTPERRALEAEVSSARAAAEGAGGWPASAVSAGTNRLTARVVLGVTIPLPLLGTLGLARREAAAHARVVRAETAASERELQRRVAFAWLALARAEANAEALALVVQQTSELVKIAQGRLDAGAGAEVDVTTARAARERAAVDAATARRDVDAASAALAAELAWEPTHTLHATGALPLGTASLDALAAQLPAHPEHALGTERVGEDEASTAVIAAERRPTLALDASTSLHDPTTPGTDVFVGLSVELPVFARIAERVRAAQARTNADQLHLQATDARLRGELVAAYTHWQAAAEHVRALDADVLPLQQRATDLAAQAYREGARDLSTALLAARDLAALRSEITAARINAAEAWIEVALASGRGIDAL